MMRCEALGVGFVLLTAMTLGAKAEDAGGPLAGHWLVTSDLHGTPIYGRLDIEQQGRKITGQFYGDKFDGSVDGNEIHFIAKSDSGGIEKVDGTLKKGVLSATVVENERADESHLDAKYLVVRRRIMSLCRRCSTASSLRQTSRLCQSRQGTQSTQRRSTLRVRMRRV
jgi:hypothetical protein